MTKRIKMPAVPEFVPKWGVLLQEYFPEGIRHAIKIDDMVRVQFRKYEEIFEGTVRKIVANKETGEVREVTVILIGDHKQFRTVTPDKLRRIPRNRQEEEEDMKVTGYTGELPKRTGGGRSRAVNPFDEHIAKGGSHQIALEKDDDVDAVKRQLRAAATFGKKSVDIFHDETKNVVLFKVIARRTRKTTAK